MLLIKCGEKLCVKAFRIKILWPVTGCMKPMRNNTALGLLLEHVPKTPGFYFVCKRYGDSPLVAEGASISTANPTAIV
jgi:hypothetical protein